jgi:hypothetical protein
LYIPQRCSLHQSLVPSNTPATSLRMIELRAMASFHPCLMVIPISHEGDVTVKCDIDIDICIFLGTLSSTPTFI